LTIFLIINVSEIMCFFPKSKITFFDIDLSGSYIWLEVEWLVFLGTLFSNALFIALRSCFTHQIQIETVPERKQLPGIDTILAIVDVANAFNAQIIPLVVSCYIYIQPNYTNRGNLDFQLK
jgi:hypothetical protein